MIPVLPQPEPPEFDSRVRQPGLTWLKNHPGAKSSEYKDYWNKVRRHVQSAFQSRCAYLGHWIPRGHIDHFIPKHKARDLTYEWSNYRYANEFVNTKKKANIFLDPLKIGPDWIDIDPVTLEFFETENLPQSYAQDAKTTLAVLNDAELVEARRMMLANYPDPHDISAYNHLINFFPLLAKALFRAGFFEHNAKPFPQTETSEA